LRYTNSFIIIIIIIIICVYAIAENDLIISKPDNVVMFSVVFVL